MIILPPNSRFLAVSILADKPVNRSIHAYALERFCVKGFIFFDIHRKQGRSSSNSGDKIQKRGWKIYSRTRTFGVEVYKSNIRWHNKYENSELD